MFKPNDLRGILDRWGNQYRLNFLDYSEAVAGGCMRDILWSGASSVLSTCRISFQGQFRLCGGSCLLVEAQVPSYGARSLSA